MNETGPLDVKMVHKAAQTILLPERCMEWCSMTESKLVELLNPAITVSPWLNELVEMAIEEGAHYRYEVESNRILPKRPTLARLLAEMAKKGRDVSNDMEREAREVEKAHKQGFIEGWYSNYEPPCKCGHLGSQHIKFHGCSVKSCTCKEFDCPCDPPEFDAMKELIRQDAERKVEERLADVRELAKRIRPKANALMSYDGGKHRDYEEAASNRCAKWIADELDRALAGKTEVAYASSAGTVKCPICEMPMSGAAESHLPGCPLRLLQKADTQEQVERALVPVAESVKAMREMVNRWANTASGVVGMCYVDTGLNKIEAALSVRDKQTPEPMHSRIK